MYKRFFAFGCSFTRYHWATWADMVHYNYPQAEYYNCGAGGSGNTMIHNRIMQADQLYNFTKEDLVIVQWSYTNRDDKWVQGTEGNPSHWLSVFNAGANNGFRIKDENFLNTYREKFITEEAILMRDLALIKSAQALLELKQCTSYQLATIDLVKDTFSIFSKDTKNSVILNLFNSYNSVLSKIKPSYQIKIFKEGWRKPGRLYSKIVEDNIDLHPTPLEHYQYLKEVLPELITKPELEQAAANDTERLRRELNEDTYTSTVISPTFNYVPLEGRNHKLY